jgi:hypothetical protein
MFAEKFLKRGCDLFNCLFRSRNGWAGYCSGRHGQTLLQVEAGIKLQFPR